MGEFLIVNPAKRRRPGSKTSSPRSRAARGKFQNPAPLGVLLSMGNPRRRRTAAQKAAFKRMISARRSNPSKRRRRRNSTVHTITRWRNAAHRRNTHHIRRRRNPIGVGGFGLGSIAKLSAGAIAGAFGTRKGTELILGPKTNEGATGLAANVAVAFGLGIAVAKFAKQPLLGVGVTVGGLVSTYDRWHMEKTLGKAASLFVSGGASTGKGMGDLEYSDWGSAALNNYISAEFSLPSYGGNVGAAVVPAANRAMGPVAA